MSAVIPAAEWRHVFASRLAEARDLTDSLFKKVCPGALYKRPIPERHRIIFYLGHLEAFDWNLIGKQGLDLPPIHEEFDQLFAFGIDPVDGGLPQDPPSAWPAESIIRKYVHEARRRIDDCLQTLSFDDVRHPLFCRGLLLNVAIEHRLMHAETFAYMLHQLPLDQKVHESPEPQVKNSNPGYRQIEIPEGLATLGLVRSERAPFGWDNEFERQQVHVPRFAVDVYNVTNGDFLKFVESGGYADRSLWKDSDWEWITSKNISHPGFWKKNGNGWLYRAMFAEIPLPLDWPVYVSHAEANAYARWRGQSLPTEAQWHRAALGTPQGSEQAFPWGNEPPDRSRGNFDSARWDPVPVASFPEGRSAFGVEDLIGNGWEWTTTVFEPFPRFEAFSFYPGYSANFFDGRHFVMKGGSARTAACLLRPTFRNWFQAHYPYMYATFRCVEN
ncbi:MAG: SUMF1/EgtB/PvdO family nonheme iron enzyme [Acidobacteriia bacterium]|nr:SUMF1/EgtB/PvdO family nonheme iron enzyme [Terriglobia bacterium]